MNIIKYEKKENRLMSYADPQYLTIFMIIYHYYR